MLDFHLVERISRKVEINAESSKKNFSSGENVFFRIYNNIYQM